MPTRTKGSEGDCTYVGVGEWCVDVAGPRLQQIGKSECQVTHSNDEVAALSSFDLPAHHLIP